MTTSHPSTILVCFLANRTVTIIVGALNWTAYLIWHVQKNNGRNVRNLPYVVPKLSMLQDNHNSSVQNEWMMQYSKNTASRYLCGPRKMKIQCIMWKSCKINIEHKCFSTTRYLNYHNIILRLTDFRMYWSQKPQ